MPSCEQIMQTLHARKLLPHFLSAEAKTPKINQGKLGLEHHQEHCLAGREKEKWLLIVDGMPSEINPGLYNLYFDPGLYNHVFPRWSTELTRRKLSNEPFAMYSVTIIIGLAENRNEKNIYLHMFIIIYIHLHIYKNQVQIAGCFAWAGIFHKASQNIKNFLIFL